MSSTPGTIAYLCYLKGQDKEKEGKTVHVPRYDDGDPPGPMRVKDYACSSGVFSFANYTEIRFEKIK